MVNGFLTTDAGLSGLLLSLIHFLTLPAGGALFCLLVFFLGKRKRGRQLFLALSLSVSLNVLLKLLFRVPQPWADHPERAPFLAEGGYALPCAHTQLAAALLFTFALTSRKRSARFLCALGIWAAALCRLWTGAQSVADVLAGLAAGILIALAIVRFPERVLLPAAAGFGLAAALIQTNGWGLGTALTAACLLMTERVFVRMECEMGFFWRALETCLGVGCYLGLYVFLPTLVEWLLAPLWPGAVLIAFLMTFLPCLFRLFG